MVVLVFFFVVGIIKMGQGGIMLVVDKVIFGFILVGVVVGVVWVVGNVSMGQVGIDMYLVNIMFMYKMDYNMGFEGVGVVIGIFSGGVVCLVSNGFVVLEVMYNCLMILIVIDNRLDSQCMQEVYEIDIVGKGIVVFNRYSDVSLYIDVVGYDDMCGCNQGYSIDNVVLV